MIRITVDAALKQALDREGRRDPLQLESFHEGDSIAQCPTCKSWMLAQSWEALGGSCACKYRPDSTQRVEMRRAPAPQTVTTTPAPPARPRLWILWSIVLLVVAIVVMTRWPPGTEQSQTTEEWRPPPPRPVAGDTIYNSENWRMIETRQASTPDADYCRVQTVSTSTDGSGGSDRRLTVRVTPRRGVGIELDAPYRTDAPIWLRIDRATQRFNFNSAARDELAVIEWFKAGLQAEFSATSSSGYPTSDLYSLVGFQNAYDAALKACWFNR